MKRFSFFSFIILCTLFISSCAGKYNFSYLSLEKLNDDLKSKFGADAWYTSIVMKDNGKGNNIITVDFTDDPNSLRQEQWELRGEWEKVTDMTVRIEKGKPEDYMFQLDKEASLLRIEKLVNLSKDVMKREDNVSDAQLKVASIISNNLVSAQEERKVYTLSFYSNTTKKNYSFVFNLNGELLQWH